MFHIFFGVGVGIGIGIEILFERALRFVVDTDSDPDKSWDELRYFRCTGLGPQCSCLILNSSRKTNRDLRRLSYCIRESATCRH
jgi:hypothetical protein